MVAELIYERNAMRSIAVLGLVLVWCLITACAGQKARENVLTPAMLIVWPAIEVQALDGGATQAEVDAFELALKISNGASVAVGWPTIKLAAGMSIDARLASGEIGVGVASSLRERLLKFGEAVLTLQGRLVE